MQHFFSFAISNRTRAAGSGPAATNLPKDDWHSVMLRQQTLRRMGLAGLNSCLLGAGLFAAGVLFSTEATAQRANTLSFNGTTQHAQVPNNSSLEFTTGTVEMWVKPNWASGSHSGANPCLISERSGATTSSTRFSLHMQNDLKSIGMWNVTGGYQTVAYTFTRGQWYHIAAVMTTSSTKFYVNGTLIGATTNGINTSQSGLNLNIGRSVSDVPTSTSAECFEGEMDEIKIWKTDRSNYIATDMATDGNATVTSDLIAYYPIDNGVLGAANAIAKSLRNAGYVSANAATLYNYTFSGTQPVVASLAPVRNAVRAARNANVTVAFSQAMNSTTASDAAVKIFGSQTGKRAGAFAGGGTSTITFDPTLDLKPGETASVTVTTAARSTDNIGLGTPQVYQFTGAAAVAPGTFDRTQNVAVPGSGFGVALGDIDRDGDLDLVTADYSGNAILVQINDGAGSYSGTQSVAVGGLPYAVKLADIDGDGDLDLLTGNANGTVSVRYNNAGVFSGTTDIYANGGLRSLEVGDVDGDGDLDIVVGNYNSTTSGTVSVMTNNGSGTFTLNAATVSVGGGSWAVALGDIDGDGDLDLVSGNYSTGTASIRFNDGTGNFSGSTDLTVGSYVQHVTLADIDGDGDLDLVATAGNSTAIRSNDGAGNFSGSTSVTLGGYESAATLGDIDGDGDLDLVSVGNNNKASVRLNNGAGVFSGTGEVVVGASPRGLALGDVDGDGDLDVVVRSTDMVSVRFNKVLAPTITSFTPASGAAGASVTINGTNFTGATSVQFNGTAATSYTVTSATQITAVVPTDATSGTIAVTTTAGTATSTQSFTVLTDLVVTNPQSISGAYRNVTITGTGDAALQGNVNVTGAFNVQNGGKLNLRGNTITGGSFTLADSTTLTIGGINGIAATGNRGGVQTTARSFSPGANYIYGSNQPGAVSGSGLPAQVRSLSVMDIDGGTVAYLTLTNDVAVAQTLRLDYDLATNGQVLTLLSTADGTALVVNNGGAVIGNVTVQRYIAGTLNPTQGYRHFSAPVSNTTVADLTTTSFEPVVNPNYNTAATPGLVTPYPTVFGYDKGRLATSPAVGYPEFDKGWFSPTTLADNMVVGAGYTVNLAAGQTVDFVGILNNGVVNLPLEGPVSNVVTSGWNLIGNPYPAPLDWSQVTIPVGLDAAMYVYESTAQYGGSYRSYVNGIGNPLVASSQAFFVRTSLENILNFLTLNNSARVTDYSRQATFQRTAETRPLVQLTLARAGSPLTDEAYVYFQTEATAGLDAAYDARKIQHNSGGAPSLYSLVAGSEVSINALPLLTASTIVPLGVQLPQAGTYTLEAAQLLNLSTATVYLRDNVTGQEVNLTQQARYTFTTATAALTNDRFSLRFEPSRTLSTSNALSAASVSVYPNPAHASFTVLIPAVSGTTQARITLLNTLGQQVRQQNAALSATGAQTTVDVAGLSAGVYTMRVQAGSTTIAKRVIVK